MFKFFFKKKAKSIQNWEYLLLEHVAKKLPAKYSFLMNQVSSNFILDSIPNEFLKKGWKRLMLNQNLYNLFINKKLNYKLIGIKIFDSLLNSYKNVEIDIYEGVIIGYRIMDTSGQFDFERIDLKHLKEIQFENSDKKEIEKIFGNLNEKLSYYFDLNDTFKIQLSEGEFYVIGDSHNGNVISIDKTGNVYGMFHDPYVIEKLFDNKEDFLDALTSGKFNASEYFRNKM